MDSVNRDSYPVISIITVVYNAEDTLEHCIKTVINQSYPSIQYIIVDGKSTDGTSDIIAKYRERIDIYVSEKDQGIYDAMNKGLDLATGDWAYFLGADDMLSTPTVVAELVEKFTKENNIYYGVTYLKSRNKLYVGKVDQWKLVLCNISHQAIFYPKDIYKTKKYELRFKYFADHIYNLELFGKYKDRFTYLPKLVSVYNDQGRSSLSPDTAHEAEIVKVIYNNFGISVAVYYWFRREVARLKKRLKS